METRICIITTAHPPFDSRIFYKQAKTLVQAGYDVVLIAQHEKDEIFDGVKIIALPKPRNRFTRMFGLTWRAFRSALRQRADVYHFHDPEFLPLGVLLKLVTGGRVIYDVHEDYPQAILSRHWLLTPLRKPIARLFDALEKRCAKRFDYVITATDHIRGRLKGTNASSIRNYPFGDDLTFEVCKREKSQDSYILIYAGSLSEEYGVKEMVQALECIDADRNVVLRLLGKFDNEKFKRQLYDMPGFTKVEYLGWHNKDEVMKNMSEADIGLVYDHPLPRFKVGISTKLLEYMSVGLPVITPNYPFWKEIVEGNDCGLTVSPLDARKLARAIEYLLAHLEEAHRMGENGRRAVQGRYNWETEGGKLLDIYSRLLRG